MKRLETVSVALTEPMLRAIRDAVDSGDYANAGEVVRDALRSWRIRRLNEGSGGADPKARGAERDTSKDD